MTEIKKGIPAPVKPASPNLKYPFASMEIGDCFDTEFRNGETEEAALRRMRSTTATWRIRHNSSLTFVVRVVEIEGRNVLRVWAQQGELPKKREGMIDEFF